MTNFAGITITRFHCAQNILISSSYRYCKNTITIKNYEKHLCSRPLRASSLIFKMQHFTVNTTHKLKKENTLILQQKQTKTNEITTNLASNSLFSFSFFGSPFAIRITVKFHIC